MAPRCGRSTWSLDAMNLLSLLPISNLGLAQLACALFGAALGVLVPVVFLTALVIDPIAWMRSSPADALTLLLMVAALVVSGFALTRLERATVRNPSRFWGVSLASNVIIVTALAADVGVQAGLLFCIPQLLSITVHLIALLPRREPVMASNYRLDRP